MYAGFTANKSSQNRNDEDRLGKDLLEPVKDADGFPEHLGLELKRKGKQAEEGKQMDGEAQQWSPVTLSTTPQGTPNLRPEGSLALLRGQFSPHPHQKSNLYHNIEKTL